MIIPAKVSVRFNINDSTRSVHAYELHMYIKFKDPNRFWHVILGYDLMSSPFSTRAESDAMKRFLGECEELLKDHDRLSRIATRKIGEYFAENYSPTSDKAIASRLVQLSDTFTIEVDIPDE